MAVAAREVRVAAGSDHLVAVQRETVYDPETGVAAQVEKTVVAVDQGDGTVAVHERQRIVGAVVAPPTVSLVALSAMNGGCDNTSLADCYSIKVDQQLDIGRDTVSTMAS